MSINKNEVPESVEIEEFLKNISFNLPDGFLNFFKEANGAAIESKDNYTLLCPLTEMLQLNIGYGVEEFAPEFFIFGSDGGNTAFAIERSTGNIFELPFIGMSPEEAIFVAHTFDEFLNSREE